MFKRKRIDPRWICNIHSSSSCLSRSLRIHLFIILPCSIKYLSMIFIPLFMRSASAVSDSVILWTKVFCPWDSPGNNTGVGCHFLLQCMKVKRENEVAQPYLTLSDPMDCSLPGSSFHGILQERVLEWGAIAFYRWPFLQSGNRDTEVENKWVDIKGREGGGMNWHIGADIYTLWDR